jgi:hypothetical protein
MLVDAGREGGVGTNAENARGEDRGNLDDALGGVAVHSSLDGLTMKTIASNHG